MKNKEIQDACAKCFVMTLNALGNIGTSKEAPENVRRFALNVLGEIRGSILAIGE